MDRRRSNVARTQIFIRLGQEKFTGNSRTQWYVGTIAWLPTNDFSAPSLWPNRGLHLYGVVPMRLYFSFIYFAVLNVVTGRGVLQIHPGVAWILFPLVLVDTLKATQHDDAVGFWIGRCFLQHCDRKRQPGWLAVLCLIFARASFFLTNQILQVLKSGFHMLDRMVLVIWFLFFCRMKKKHVMPCFTDFFRGSVSFRGNNEWVQLWWDQPNIWTSSMCQWFQWVPVFVCRMQRPKLTSTCAKARTRWVFSFFQFFTRRFTAIVQGLWPCPHVIFQPFNAIFPTQILVSQSMYAW